MNKVIRLITFSVVCIIAVVLTTTAINLFNNKTIEDVVITNSKGKSNSIALNLTYMHNIETFDNTFTVIADNTVKQKEESDVRVTTGFAAPKPIYDYVYKNGYKDILQFRKEKGNVSMYYQYKNKKYYLLQNVTTKPYCWNLLIDNEGNYNLIELCKIAEPNNSNSSRLSFAKKIEVINNKIRFYVESGIYTVDNNNNISVNKLDLNTIFANISKEYNIKYSSLQIEYLDDYFYVLGKDDNKSYLICYNVKENTSILVPLNHIAQDITIINGKIAVISVRKNRLYIEEYDEIIDCKSVDEINEFKPINFAIGLYCKTLVDNNTISITLSGDPEISNNKTYFITLDLESLRLINYKEYTLKKDDYMLYGVQMYVKE